MQHPERVEEEQTVKVVENHEGGTWERLATDPRSEHGDVHAGVGSSAPKTVKGRSLETRTRRRETTSCHATRETARQARGAASGVILLLGSTTTMQMSEPRGSIIEHDERTRGSGHRILKGTMPPDGVSVEARGIPRP